MSHLTEVEDALTVFEQAVANAALVSETGTSEQQTEEADNRRETARTELLRLLNLYVL